MDREGMKNAKDGVIKVVTKLNKKDLDGVLTDKYKVDAEKNKAYLRVWCQEFVDYENNVTYLANQVISIYKGYLARLDEMQASVEEAYERSRFFRFMLSREQRRKFDDDYVSTKRLILHGESKLNEIIDNATEELEYIDYFAGELCGIVESNPKLKNQPITYSGKGDNDEIDFCLVDMLNSEELLVDNIDRCDPFIKEGMQSTLNVVNSFIGSVNGVIKIFNQMSDDSHDEK